MANAEHGVVARAKTGKGLATNRFECGLIEDVKIGRLWPRKFVNVGLEYQLKHVWGQGRDVRGCEESVEVKLNAGGRLEQVRGRLVSDRWFFRFADHHHWVSARR